MQHIKEKQKEYYDKGSRQLKPLSERDVVRVAEPTGWRKKATVLKEINPRSYLVHTEDGQTLRRNRQSLLKTAEKCPLDEPTVELMSPEMQSCEMPSMPSVDQQLDPDSELDSSVPKTDIPVLRRSNRVRKPLVRMDL